MSMTMTTPVSFEARHKPERFTELVFAHSAIRQQLALYAQRQMHGNLLLYGAYGTAKSATARVIVQERLKACGIPDGNLAQVHALEIKGNVKQAENHINLLLMTNHADPQPYVIIDELDQLSAADQKQLRALLDTYKVLKLICTTNHLNDVDGGLRSRSDCVCVMPPTAQDWLPRAQQILAAENVIVPDAALLAVLGLSQDARAIMRKLEQLAISKPLQQAQSMAAPVLSVVPNPATPMLSSATTVKSVATMFSVLPNTVTLNGVSTP